jgi:hypothetical protein
MVVNVVLQDDAAMMEETSTTEISALERLSPDTMNLVLSFVTFTDYNNISLCSKLLERAVSQASHLYMQGVDEDHDASSDRRHQAKNTMLITSSVQLLDNKNRLRRLLNRFDNLTSLQLHDNGAGIGGFLLASIGDHLIDLLNAAPAAQRTLQSLTLHRAVLTPLCRETLHLPHLKHLHLSGGSIRLDLAALFGKETNENDDDCEDATTRRSPPQLQSLYIAHCSSLRDRQLCDLVHRVGGSSSSRSHNDNAYDNSNDAGLQSLSSHQCLRIKKPILQLSRLQHLSLFGCFALTQLPRFSCPQLVVLDLSS